MSLHCMEVGSLPKLPGRAAKLRGQAIGEREAALIAETVAVSGSRRVGEIAEGYMELVQRPGLLTPEERAAIVDANVRFNVALLEEIGMDHVWDGEAQRTEMYDGVVRHVRGLVPTGAQISFVNVDGYPNTFSPRAYASPLALDQPLHTAELERVQRYAAKPVRVPVTGAYTLATWTDPGELKRRLRGQGHTGRQAERIARSALIGEFALNVINPTLRALAEKWPARIQIDEPNATAFPDEELIYDSLAASVEGVYGPDLGVHVCFSSDYGLVARAIARVPAVRFVTLELANRDTRDHAVYQETVRQFEEAGFRGIYVLGVANVHTDSVEPVGLMQERARAAVEELGGYARVELAPDCGLRSRTLPVAARKLLALAEAARSYA